MPYAKLNRAGRPKGSKNRLTPDLKAAIIAAARSVGRKTPDAFFGLHDVPRDALERYLVRFGLSEHKEERIALLNLVGRVLPMTLAGDGPDGRVTIVIKQEPLEIPAIEHAETPRAIEHAHQD